MKKINKIMNQQALLASSQFFKILHTQQLVLIILGKTLTTIFLLTFHIFIVSNYAQKSSEIYLFIIFFNINCD